MLRIIAFAALVLTIILMAMISFRPLILLFLPPVFFSMGGIEFKTVYLIIFKADKTVGMAEVKQVLKGLQSFGFLTLLTGLMGMLIGLILMLHNLDIPETIGPSMQISLHSLLFALVFRVLVYGAEYNVCSRHHLWNDFLKKQAGSWSVYLCGLFTLLTFFVLLFALSYDLMP